jgi:hypothetical protein
MRLRHREPQIRGRIADNGRVRCPDRGSDVELDICIGCPALRDIVTSAGWTYLDCRPRTGLLLSMAPPV